MKLTIMLCVNKLCVISNCSPRCNNNNKRVRFLPAADPTTGAYGNVFYHAKIITVNARVSVFTLIGVKPSFFFIVFHSELCDRWRAQNIVSRAINGTRAIGSPSLV
ncbi:hypothetical protein AVEN_13308-1 [Araneus ventricosus]|uniref:Uncharacterized protein n=1 Tax=Araneus ventricosus TaxID=182803 RepID=A0A4Y2IJX5_ARAVE|nr:hypothetical protein AVEN_13308-1 [Araneus ventricosus]